ncbi:MAG: YggS family pyridoxal phosphate-dependent enzyme [Pyrinomonadaceae bacterium]
MPSLRHNYQGILDRIAAAAERAARDPADVKLVAVSKTHPVEVLRDALTAGIRVLGENKVQEAEEKVIELGPSAAEWHLIGHLQSNKVRKAVQLFDVVHSVDSIELAERLERICAEAWRERLDILVQVDLAGEETKSGIDEAELPKLVEHLAACEHLAFKGLMVLPPFFDDPEATRSYFQRLRRLRDQLIPGGDLSMGMSHDFEVAIEEGATIVRVGTAIFGERHYGTADGHR